MFRRQSNLIQKLDPSKTTACNNSVDPLELFCKLLTVTLRQTASNNDFLILPCFFNCKSWTFVSMDSFLACQQMNGINNRHIRMSHINNAMSTFFRRTHKISWESTRFSAHPKLMTPTFCPTDKRSPKKSCVVRFCCNSFCVFFIMLYLSIKGEDDSRNGPRSSPPKGGRKSGLRSNSLAVPLP